jgi:hypothetical protein
VTGVQIVDTLPDAVSFVDASSGGQPLGNQIVWNLGDVARGSAGTVSYPCRRHQRCDDRLQLPE